jgi:hypothetical protein
MRKVRKRELSLPFDTMPVRTSTETRPKMGPLRAAVTLVLLVAGLASCGGSNTDGSSRAASTAHSSATATPAANSEASSTAPLDTTVDADKDNDVTAGSLDDANNDSAMTFGREASPSERRAIVPLIKRYYATALTEDGARGCSMVYSTLAEAAVEDDAQAPGPQYERGAKSCAEVLRRMFVHEHAQIAAQVPKLEVTHIRLVEHHGVAFLRFGALAEREISVAREGRTWKMDTIYDQELP